MRGEVVRKLQHGLNVTDAPHFYNLSSLEGVLVCLMHVTARYVGFLNFYLYSLGRQIVRPAGRQIERLIDMNI
jgi:hypothetical protein